MLCLFVFKKSWSGLAGRSPGAMPSQPRGSPAYVYRECNATYYLQCSVLSTVQHTYYSMFTGNAMQHIIAQQYYMRYAICKVQCEKCNVQRAICNTKYAMFHLECQCYVN